MPLRRLDEAASRERDVEVAEMAKSFVVSMFYQRMNSSWPESTKTWVIWLRFKTTKHLFLIFIGMVIYQYKRSSYRGGCRIEQVEGSMIEMEQPLLPIATGRNPVVIIDTSGPTQLGFGAG